MKSDQPESSLKKIISVNVSSFVPRRSIKNAVISAVDNPSWLLRIDRHLMKHSKHLVSPLESEFCGRSFEELAGLVRRQDSVGKRITRLIADYGVTIFADLNSNHGS